MNPLASLLSLLLVLMIGSEALAKGVGTEEVDVYLLGGQSNMQGIGKLAQLDAEEKEVLPNVFFWTDKGFERFVPGRTKTSARKGEFGPELGMARALSHQGRAIYIVKHFASGMPLHHGWNGGKWVGGRPKPGQVNFYPGRKDGDPQTGKLYMAMRRRFAAALTALRVSGHEPRVRGFVWMQGEQDCKREESARNYAANLKRLRRRLQEDLGIHDLAFAFGKVLPMEKTKPRFTHRALLLAQMDAADMASGKPKAMFRTRCVETKGMELLPDRVHFSARGQLALGRALAVGILEALASGVQIPLWPDRVPGFPADYAHRPPIWLSAETMSEVSRAELRVFPARRVAKDRVKVPDKGRARSRASVLIFPGGGYRALAVRKEGDRVAAYLAGRGYTCFTLRYRVTRKDAAPFRFPGPLLDARQAIRIIRSRARSWGIDPDKLGVMGFSAGGHLAAMCATRYDDDLPGQTSSGDSLRPAFAALIYPVATMLGNAAHKGSRRALLGASPTEAELIAASPERRLTRTSPPLFLVHNQFDRVSSLATLTLARAATRVKVPCELHVYPSGQHGFGMGRQDASVSKNPAIAWPDLLLAFLARQ